MIIIPARYNSKRFPGKVLLYIKGRPMIQWIYDTCSKVDKTLIACDQQVYQILKDNENVRLVAEAQNGTERAAQLEIDEDIVLVQADIPFVEESLIRKVKGGLSKDNLVTLMTKTDSESPNTVKVVTDKDSYALYFSRSRIPSKGQMYKHIGIYGFKKGMLSKYLEMKSTIDEDLEQLRWLENGYKIKVIEVDEDVLDVNVPEDSERDLWKS